MDILDAIYIVIYIEAIVYIILLGVIFYRAS